MKKSFLTMIIELSGLTCLACKKLSEKRIASIPGVKGVEVEISSGRAIINADRVIKLEEIKEALKDTPYQVV